MEEQLIKILQEHPGEPFSHVELLKLTNSKSRPELKKILGKLIKNNPTQFGAKTVSRIAVVWAREAKVVSPAISDESDALKKRIIQLEKETQRAKELETEHQKLKDELKKKESKKETQPSKTAEEIKEKLLEDLVDTLTEEFPTQIATKNELKQFFEEVVPVVLKRYL